MCALVEVKVTEFHQRTALEARCNLMALDVSFNFPCLSGPLQNLYCKNKIEICYLPPRLSKTSTLALTCLAILFYSTVHQQFVNSNLIFNNSIYIC